jgi:ABC-type multidrug transport system ATPase subunit
LFIGRSVVNYLISYPKTTGGQRKRTNIATEIVSLPFCLCLDEPTSGLDSTSALELTKILSQMSRLGMTVISVMHQPRKEIFECFDDCLMLTPGGKIAYFASTKKAKRYFQELGFEFSSGSNEADVIMDRNTIQNLSYDDLAERWNSSSLRRHQSTKTLVCNDALFYSQAKKAIQKKGAGFIKQVWYCRNLSIMQQYRRINGFVLDFLQEC